MKAGRGARASRSSSFRPATTLKGPAMRCFAARRSSPATAFAATCGATSGSASGWESRSFRWSWSTRDSTTSIPAFARWRPTWHCIIPAPSTNTAARCLRDRIPHLIEVAVDEAVSFSCNAVVVGKTVILNEAHPSWPPPSRDRGFAVHLLGFSEFIKSGGSAKCLTFRVDGEEAASWKTESDAS